MTVTKMYTSFTVVLMSFYKNKEYITVYTTEESIQTSLLSIQIDKYENRPKNVRQTIFGSKTNLSYFLKILMGFSDTFSDVF